MGAEFAKLIYLIPILLWLGAATWVTWDSFQRSGEWGLLWGFFAFGCAPVTVPVYIICILIADRPAPEWVRREQSFMKEQATKYKLMGDIERTKFIEAQQSKGGTLYNPGGLQPHDRGVRYFTDAEAEALIGAHDYAGAFIYLYDLYSLSTQNSDLRGVETYKHYIGELPQGRDWLSRAIEKQVTPGHLKAAGIGLLETLQGTTAIPASSSLIAQPGAAPSSQAATPPLSVPAPVRPQTSSSPKVPF